MVHIKNDANEKALLEAFNKNQQEGLLLVLKKFRNGLSLDQLMIEARLSENTVLSFLNKLDIKEIDGVFKAPES